MHQLMDEARAISEELGLNQEGMPGKGFMRGEHQRLGNASDQLPNTSATEN